MLSDPTPTICRWCQRLQFAIRFKFMANRYLALPRQLLPNFTDEGFYTLQAASLSVKGLIIGNPIWKDLIAKMSLHPPCSLSLN